MSPTCLQRISSNPCRNPRHCRRCPLNQPDFLGGYAELQEISRALLDPGCRLLTLLGPGGIGKTRLALNSGEQLQSAFDAVYFVSLRQVASPDQIAPAIADVLQLPRLSQADPLFRVAAYLREVQPKTLLILDNFEHLMEGAEVVDLLLETAREIKAAGHIARAAALDLGTNASD